MKRVKRISYGLTLSLACATLSLACASKDPATDTPTEGLRAGLDRAPARAAAREQGLRTRRDHILANDPQVSGVVTVQDDSLTNSHSLTATLFTGQTGAAQCFDTFPLDGGGQCYRPKPCDNPAPTTAGQPADLGTLEVKSTFDVLTADYDPGQGQYSAAGGGPFWRGDGDSVSVSFVGQEGVAPPFQYSTRAPVGDAIVTLPTMPVDRAQGLSLEWNYAVGTAAAVGNMQIVLFQSEALVCIVPMINRSARVPAAALDHFTEGPAIVLPNSEAPDSTPQGNTKVFVVVQATVDTNTQGIVTFQ
jgi:hypothetical protein